MKIKANIIRVFNTQFYRQSRRMEMQQQQKQLILQKSNPEQNSQIADLLQPEQVPAQSKILPSTNPSISQDKPIIKYFTGYSSFIGELAQMNGDGKADSIDSMPKYTYIRNQTRKKLKENTVENSVKEGSQTIARLEESLKSGDVEGGEVKVRTMINESQERAKGEEDQDFERSARKQTKRLTNKMVYLDGKKIKRSNKGMLSIASRKYQPIPDSRQVFDEEELANNIMGPDQCRLWKNLMNKYILKTKGIKNKKNKDSVKCQFNMGCNSLEGKESERSIQIEMPVQKEQNEEHAQIKHFNGYKIMLDQPFVKKEQEQPVKRRNPRIQSSEWMDNEGNPKEGTVVIQIPDQPRKPLRRRGRPWGSVKKNRNV